MLHKILPDIEKLETRLRTIVPAGYMLALNIRHLTPEFFKSTYPSDWVTIYTERRYVLFDPIVAWARFSIGTTRWSEIPTGFSRAAGLHILDHASQFGLNYGGVVSSRGPAGSHCLCVLSGAREDRDLRASELISMTAILEEIADAVGEHAGLTEVELEALRDLAAGLTHNEIADQRGVSPATIKKRLERAREVLGARNAVHAVAIATRRGLIFADPTF
ncbi:LuxR family transcriptional regulator [Tabrizicola sp.]|uniref:helix-turn-helix transcriptional regulator n=1 Tax=Tabrizicola sp. TaxID=2005166 RepID=UPI002733AE3F|nr:LuxR family transcriptional regulator [Tabrizicola sp.]MDP3193842.1 LuxR family transcriptional regulator [Tabrizicola sp.]MDZ4066005.1 LuxR family transcriptional regulator [Tabrizicola sp.]